MLNGAGMVCQNGCWKWILSIDKGAKYPTDIQLKLVLQKKGDWQRVSNKLQNDDISDECLTKKMIVSVSKYVLL